MQDLIHDLHVAGDETHWWFVARRRILMDLLEHRVPARPLRLLDVGCGAGATLRELGRFGEAVGMDPAPRAVAEAAQRSGCVVRLGALPDPVPFEDESFDVVTLLDVLEHIPDDAAALARVVRLLRPGGLLLCTVPAFQFLWSEHDELNQHQRRYNRSVLGARLKGAGLRLRKLSYYNALLFLPVAAIRLARPAKSGSADLAAVPRPLNALLRSIFASERHWLRRGSFPFGVSLVALAEKPINES